MQPSDLERAVNRQSWEWLLDVPHRLNVAIEVIDDRRMPVFPAGSTPAAVAIRRMLTIGEPSLVSAIADVLRSTTPAEVEADGLQGLCLGLSHGGVLVLARQLEGGDSAIECRKDLELIGAWLTTVIEASLAKPPNGVAVEPFRIASLQRILSDAMARGSVRRVIGAFVEAVGVWDSVLIHAYALAASGGFFQYVSPVGVPASLPAELDGAVVPPDSGMVRLSRAEIDRLGLASAAGDVLILRLRAGGDIACVLVFSGTIDGHEQVRLTLYSDMLRESLNDVLATATNRVIAAMTGPALPPNEPLDETAQMALQRLSAAVGGHQAALVVTTATGRQALVVGETGLLAALELHVQPDQHVRPDPLVVTSSDPSSTLSVVVGREQLPFTSFEREIVQAGATVLHSWLRAALEGSKESERRRQFRPVDALFDQLAAEAVDAGQPASVIVVSVNATELTDGLLQTWLGRTRSQLRAGDFAGILSDTEMAVLLCDASTNHAAVVSARLKQLMESDDSTGAFLQPAFGMTTRSPASPFEGSLVGAARADAAAAR